MATKMDNTTPNGEKLYEKFNMDDILIRSVIAGLLDLLNNKIDYTQAWGDNIEETVRVPWMYNMGSSDERFVQDNYMFFGQNCFWGEKITGTFSSIPRGIITYSGSQIESNAICNRFVQGTYLKNINGKLATYTSFLYSMPITANFDCTVICDNVITALKIEQAIRATFFKNKTFFVQFRGMRIGCTAGFPEQITNDVVKTTEYSFDSQQKRPQLTFNIAVETYQPVFDKTTEMLASNKILSIGSDITVKAQTDKKWIKFKDTESLVYPSGTPCLLEWTYSSDDTEMYNVRLSYTNECGEEHDIEKCMDNQMFYVWNIPEKMSKFVQPTITVDDEERVIHMPSIKILPNKDTKLIDEKSFVVVSRGYIVPYSDMDKIGITIEYKDIKGKLKSVSGKYFLNLENGRVSIENPVTIVGEPEKYIGKMDFCRISLKIEYTKDSEIFDEIHNLLIM